MSSISQIVQLYTYLKLFDSLTELSKLWLVLFERFLKNVCSCAASHIEKTPEASKIMVSRADIEDLG